MISRYASPAGELILGDYRGSLCACDWVAGRRSAANARRLQKALGVSFEERSTGLIARTARELDEYFAGERREFDVPLLLIGSEFQRAVWAELMKIPYTVRISYGELALRLGRPRAVRAVASAVGANPLSIIVPCHRVVGSSGSLTGYAGGLPAKQSLLHLETTTPVLKEE